MNDKIRELLGEELSKQVAEKLGTVELAVANDGTWMPVDKYDTLKATHKALEEKYNNDIADFNTKLEAATKDVGDIDTLKQSLVTLQKDNEDLMAKYQSDTLDIKLDSKMDVALLKANADPACIPFLKTKIKKESLSFEGEEVIGLSDFVNKLQTDLPRMFGEVKKAGPTPGEEKKNPPMGEKAKLMERYNSAKSVAEKLAIQREIKQLKE